MSVRVATYDPAKISVRIAGQVISGFAPGTFLEVTYDGNLFEDDVGVDGEPVRWDSRNPFASMNLELMYSSPSNRILGLLATTDKLSQAGLLPVIVEDLSGKGRLPPPRLISASGWVKAWPGFTWADEASTRRWTVRLLNMIVDTAGLSSAPVLNKIL